MLVKNYSFINHRILPYAICLFRAPVPLSRDHIFLGLSVTKGTRVFIFFVLIHNTKIPIIFWKELSLQLCYHSTQVSLISSSSFDTEQLICLLPTDVLSWVPNSISAELLPRKAHGTRDWASASPHPQPQLLFMGSCFGDSSCPAPLSKQGFPN